MLYPGLIHLPSLGGLSIHVKQAQRGISNLNSSNVVCQPNICSRIANDSQFNESYQLIGLERTQPNTHLYGLFLRFVES